MGALLAVPQGVVSRADVILVVLLVGGVHAQGYDLRLRQPASWMPGTLRRGSTRAQEEE